jgi:hypothetical protein
MAAWLLLYDTKEKDLARDLRELVREIGLDLIMIPYAPDRGTLESKEQHYMENAAGLVFFITAGSERDGKKYASPSVTDEMGRAKQIFKDKRDKVIYLKEEDCNVQAVDQQTYIPFDRGDIRSVLEALAQLVRDLRAAGALPPAGAPPKLDMASFSARTSANAKEICSELSRHTNGWMYDDDLRIFMTQTLGLAEQDMTFVKHDIRQLQLVSLIKGSVGTRAMWILTPLGIELAKYERRKRDEGREAIAKIRSKP